MSSFAVYRNDIPIKKDWSKRMCTMTTYYQNHIDRMINFKSRPDDLWIVTFPKCGTTWMQEMAWLVQNDFNFEKTKSVPLSKRSPYVE